MLIKNGKEEFISNIDEFMKNYRITFNLYIYHLKEQILIYHGDRKHFFKTYD